MNATVGAATCWNRVGRGHSRGAERSPPSAWRKGAVRRTAPPRTQGEQALRVDWRERRYPAQRDATDAVDAAVLQISAKPGVTRGTHFRFGFLRIFSAQRLAAEILSVDNHEQAWLSAHAASRVTWGRGGWLKAGKRGAGPFWRLLCCLPVRVAARQGWARRVGWQGLSGRRRPWWPWSLLTVFTRRVRSGTTRRTGAGRCSMSCGSLFLRAAPMCWDCCGPTGRRCRSGPEAGSWGGLPPGEMTHRHARC